MRRVESRQHIDRMPGKRPYRTPWVHQTMDERTVRAVFQQTTDQVGKQILVIADRRVNTDGPSVSFHGVAVKRVAHAMQTLKFKVLAIARHHRDRRRGMGVVGCELRKNIAARAFAKQETGAREIGNVGRFLARVNGIVRITRLLRPLDLAVPIRALDQTQRNQIALFPGERAQPCQNGKRAFRVSLHHQAKPPPTPREVAAIQFFEQF